jgi:cholesterol transport system auxiliary component
MRRFIIILCAMLLAACVGNPPRLVEIARHDLGDPVDTMGRWPATGIAISRIDVRVATWLDSPLQLYRLNYADPLRRQSYAENRWVAPPGELLERWLQRRILSGQNEVAGPGCRLVLWLDELEQRFDTPRSSQVVLDARASLQPLRGDTILAQQEFHLVKAAPTPDARGGVQATRAGADALTQELARWLGDLARERPQTIAMCKEKS